MTSLSTALPGCEFCGTYNLLGTAWLNDETRQDEHSPTGPFLSCHACFNERRSEDGGPDMGDEWMALPMPLVRLYTWERAE